MTEISAILLNNFITLCLIFGLGIITIASQTFDKRTKRYFIAFIILVLVLDIADMADYYLSGLPYPSVLRYLTSALGYTLRTATLVVIASILLRRKKFSILLWVPLILLGVAAFSNYFTHLLFWFDEANQFHRGVLSYAPHFISAGYMLLLVLMSVRMNRLISAGEICTIAYITIICSTATILESTTSVKFLLPGTMMVAYVMYYVYLYVQINRRDILTGLPNRRSFYADAKKLTIHPLFIISMDMNGLKDINDSSGHLAGDRALQTFAEIIMTHSGKRFFAYRTGGDEFMTLAVDATADEAEAYIEKIRADLKIHGLMASFGYAEFAKGGCFDDICNLADSRMYKDKSLYKHRATER